MQFTGKSDNELQVTLQVILWFIVPSLAMRDFYLERFLFVSKSHKVDGEIAKSRWRIAKIVQKRMTEIDGRSRKIDSESQKSHRRITES